MGRFLGERRIMMRAMYIWQCSDWGLSLAGGMGLSCQLCPSSVPLKVMLGLHIIAAWRDSGPLQHKCSCVANGTGIIAAVWKRRKTYIARLDKTLRYCQLGAGRAPARWSICTWKSTGQKISTGAFVLPSAGQQLARTYSDSQETRAQGSSRRSVFI